MTDDRGFPPDAQSLRPQSVKRQTNLADAKRVPSALTPDRQREAVRAVRAGRSVHQVAAEFSVSESVIFELWKRDTERKTREILDSLRAQVQEIDDELRGQRDLQYARRLLKAIQDKFLETDFYLDDSPLTIYKLSVPGDQEEQKVENLYILERNGQPRLLTHQSAIISKVPKRVRTVRIFADARDGLLTEIRNEAKTLERTV